jgi:hypothetical protein
VIPTVGAPLYRAIRDLSQPPPGWAVIPTALRATARHGASFLDHFEYPALDPRAPSPPTDPLEAQGRLAPTSYGCGS